MKKGYITDTDPEQLFALIPMLTKKEKELLNRVCSFAEKSHQGQLRKSGEPNYLHLFKTGINLAACKMDVETISAGILHEIFEETKITKDELEKEFGREIVSLVFGVTKLSGFRYQGDKQHVESLRKFFVAMADDIRVVVIKLCDRLHNIQTLQYVSPEKQKRIALETLEIHARLADRLGMGRLKAQLEDAAFPYIYPDEYKKTTELFRSSFPLSDERIQTLVRTLKEKLLTFDITIEQIDYRVKPLYSLLQKLKQHEMDVTKIHDIVALRIIVPIPSDCYLALGALHDLYRPFPGRFKDYIATPKPNGYQSLHTTIFSGDGGTIEIQIRTKEMHHNAEYGTSSHLLYKESGKKVLSNKTREQLNWTQRLLNTKKEETSQSDTLKRLHSNCFQSRTFVLTPKGDIIDLPEGSTPIDFAYAVHSEIGDHIASAKINNKRVPLETILKNLDIVEIDVKKTAHPKKSWVELVKTALAKRKVKNYIKDHNKAIEDFMP